MGRVSGHACGADGWSSGLVVGGLGEDELGGYMGPWSAGLQGFGDGAGWRKVT